MAINEEARRKEFKNCTSFDELGRLCDKYWYVFEYFADEVRNKMYSLPIEFNESFIHFLLKLELYEIFLNLSRQSSSTRFALNSSMLPKRRKYYILYSNHYYLLCSRKKKRKGSSLKTYVII